MENSDINHLRHLLFNLDQEELDKLKKLLNYPNDLALEIAKVLPEAILFSIRDSERLSSALMPMIEMVITRSVAQNPRLLADALYPIIGRSIRKSINEEFKKLLITFNELIENTFSYRALKWRYQAAITGRKYSEVVISNTIKYKAEHVFLIHRETGLLLYEVHDEMNRSADADTISGMLKAITDFVHDSFQGTGNSELNLIEMEDYQVLIEQGPYAIIAALVKGYTLDEYRKILVKTLEKVHVEYASSFQSFSGDTFVFETSRDLLSKCLKTEKKEEFITKKSKIGLLIAVPLIAVALFFVGRAFYFNRQWNQYIHALQQNELVLLSQHLKSNRTYYVNGMILPGAVHPDSIVGQYHFPKTRLESNWHLYIQGDQKMILTFIDENFGILQNLSISPNQNQIILSGRIGEQKLLEFRQFIQKNLSWFTLIDENLSVTGIDAVSARIQEFNRYHLYFKIGDVALTSNSTQLAGEYAEELKSIIADAQLVSDDITLMISGYADQFGDFNYNQILSLKRAEFVKLLLIQSGIPGHMINIEGKGVLEGSEDLVTEKRRRVDFILTLESQPSND